MILSHKYKFIYLRCPKTGSTSIEYLLKNIDPDCIFSNNEKYPYGHETYDQIKEMLPENIFDNYFKFTFMREPKSWFLSQYSYNSRYTHNNDKLFLILNDENKLNDPENKIIDTEDFISLYILLKKWFKGHSQLLWVNNDLDYIGDFNNLNKDFEIIKNLLHIDNSEQIPTLNKSKSQLYSLSEDSEKLFYVLFKKDVDFYEKNFNKI